jgi:hypothetical protein
VTAGPGVLPSPIRGGIAAVATCTVGDDSGMSKAMTNQVFVR